ncbi:MAG: hypothetical protein HY055_17535, partial [Magnetospirillum sp.]|nr:hypothetical protein [Magnetospirillum sp.]
MRVQRHYTKTGETAYDGIEFRKATSEIRNPDGSIVFQLADIEVPAEWSQVACDILAQKYFRKAGLHGKKELGETSVRQVVYRLAHTLDRKS